MNFWTAEWMDDVIPEEYDRDDDGVVEVPREFALVERDIPERPSRYEAGRPPGRDSFCKSYAVM